LILLFWYILPSLILYLTIFYFLLNLGRDIWKQSRSAIGSAKIDIHAKLMKRYKQVPEWWFLILLIGSIALSLLMSFIWKKDVQLPWWGMLFAFGLAFIVTLPIGVIQATTNQVCLTNKYYTKIIVYRFEKYIPK
jgi:4-hydroxybenzoate polyprenyltransferase